MIKNIKNHILYIEDFFRILKNYLPQGLTIETQWINRILPQCLQHKVYYWLYNITSNHQCAKKDVIKVEQQYIQQQSTREKDKKQITPLQSVFLRSRLQEHGYHFLKLIVV